MSSAHTAEEPAEETGEANAAPVPTPQGEALRWVAVAHEGVQNRLLVARGDAFDLEVWTNEAEPTRDDAGAKGRGSMNMPPWA